MVVADYFATQVCRLYMTTTTCRRDVIYKDICLSPIILRHMCRLRMTIEGSPSCINYERSHGSRVESRRGFMTSGFLCCGFLTNTHNNNFFPNLNIRSSKFSDYFPVKAASSTSVHPAGIPQSSSSVAGSRLSPKNVTCKRRTERDGITQKMEGK